MVLGGMNANRPRVPKNYSVCHTQVLSPNLPLVTGWVWFMRHVLPLMFVLLLLPAFSFMFLVPAVHAASTLVQQNNAGCASPGPCSSATVAFTNPVTSGNVIVAAIAVLCSSFCNTQPLQGYPGGVADTLGSTFTLAGANWDTNGHYAFIFTATVPSTGSDTVTVTLKAAPSLPIAADVYVYEVSGVTTSGAGTAGGHSGVNSPFSTDPVTFATGAFLLGVVEGESPCGTFAAGTGFTASLAVDSTNCVSHAEYATSGVSSPTTFPATIAPAPTYPWVESSLALNAAAPIPEYPLGLLLLAVFMVISYGLIRRRTSTRVLS